MSKRWVLAGLVISSLVLVACGDDKKDSGSGGDSAGESASDAAGGGMPTEAEMARQAEATREALKQANDGREIKAVAAADLKAVLPAEIAGMRRKNAEGSHQSMGGLDMSTFRADYEPEPPADGEMEGAERPSYHVEITDLGNASGPMAASMTMWATMSYERESDTGYEKTTKHKGRPAVEKYESESRNGELQCIVSKRFIVKVEGNNATIEQIRAAMDAVDVAKLESLAN